MSWTVNVDGCVRGQTLVTKFEIVVKAEALGYETLIRFKMVQNQQIHIANQIQVILYFANFLFLFELY